MAWRFLYAERMPRCRSMSLYALGCRRLEEGSPWFVAPRKTGTAGEPGEHTAGEQRPAMHEADDKQAIATATATATAMATAAKGPAGPTVLVVDDEQDIRAALRLILEDAGYRVIEAENGVRALDRLRMQPEGMVVLLDYMMPVLDGAGVLGTVANDGALARRHRYILMTAATKTFALAFAKLLGELGVPVMAKPFDLDRLVGMVAAAAARLR